MIRFPFIPELEDGQTLGATHLNSYRSALLYLLGESHGRYAVSGAQPRAETVYDTVWVTVWSAELHLTAWQLYYLVYGGQDYGGDKVWHARLQYCDSGGTWRDIVELSGTGGNDEREGTVNLQGMTGLSLGLIYPVRWQVRTDDATYHSLLTVWITAVRGSVSDWTTPPTFAAGASSASELNIIRADAQALYNLVSQAVEPAYSYNGWVDWALDTSYQTIGYAVLRYRPDKLWVCIRAQGSAHQLQWRVSAQPHGGTETVLWTSDVLTGPIGTPPGWVYYTADVSTSGLTAIGTYVRVKVEARNPTLENNGMKVQLAGVCRWSTGVPATGWQDPPSWSHGDATVGPTALNKLSSDLTMLYSGNEQLWLESHAMPRSPWVSGDENAILCLTRRKRYLKYYYEGSQVPSVIYGSGWTESVSLPAGSGSWQTYEIGNVSGLTLGMTYLIEGARAAVEVD